MREVREGFASFRLADSLTVTSNYRNVTPEYAGLTVYTKSGTSGECVACPQGTKRSVRSLAQSHQTGSVSLSYVRYVSSLAAVAAVYLVFGKLGLALAFVHLTATTVWPPAGIALAAYLLLGHRIWPGILLGAFLVNVTTTGTAATSAGIAAGNTLEGLLGAYLVNRFAGGLDVFRRGQDILKFTALAGVVATTVSATLGVTSLALGDFAARSDYVSIWLTWWLGDMLGVLIFAPPILLWSVNRQWPWNRRQTFEAMALFILLFAFAQAVFGGWPPLTVKNYPLTFLLAPVLIWMAFRFRQREIATANLMLCVLAIRGTLHGYGPFVMTSPGESILLLQTFMGVTALMSITVAAIFSELRRLFGELEDALSDVKTLKGLVPICAWCKKIRNAGGDWEELEAYFRKRADIDFTHGICPGCLEKSKPNS